MLHNLHYQTAKAFVKALERHKNLKGWSREAKEELTNVFIEVQSRWGIVFSHNSEARDFIVQRRHEIIQKYGISGT